MRKKKISVRKLQQEIDLLRKINSEFREIELRLERDNRELRDKLQARLDTSMMDQRIKLANSLGQMIEATSKAVMFIVAKEAV